MTFELTFQDDIFFLVPAIVLGQVGEGGGHGIAIAWLFWIGSVTA